MAAADDAPDALSTIATLTRLPPPPFVPSEHHGRLALMVHLVYAGDLDRGQRALAPLRALATPLADVVTPVPYRPMYAADVPGPEPVPMAARSMFLDELDDHAAATIYERMQAPPSPMTAVQIGVLGGCDGACPARGDRLRLPQTAHDADVRRRLPGSRPSASNEAWVADSLTAMRTLAHGVHV